MKGRFEQQGKKTIFLASFCSRFRTGGSVAHRPIRRSPEGRLPLWWEMQEGKALLPAGGKIPHPPIIR